MYSGKRQFAECIIRRFPEGSRNPYQGKEASLEAFISKAGRTFVNRRSFPRARVVSPERTAGQTACPEEHPARAKKIRGDERNCE